MAGRTDYYFRQKVTEAELDLAFELLEKADRNLAADIGVYGIISGAEPTPHSPVPNLTIDLTAPARAYDNLGQRIFFGTGQVVDCSVDLSLPKTRIRHLAALDARGLTEHEIGETRTSDRGEGRAGPHSTNVGRQPSLGSAADRR